jgi:hypothetical protein
MTSASANVQTLHSDSHRGELRSCAVIDIKEDGDRSHSSCALRCRLAEHPDRIWSWRGVGSSQGYWPVLRLPTTTTRLQLIASPGSCWHLVGTYSTNVHGTLSVSYSLATSSDPNVERANPETRGRHALPYRRVRSKAGSTARSTDTSVVAVRGLRRAVGVVIASGPSRRTGAFHRLVQFIVTSHPSKVASLLVGGLPGESSELLKGHRSF